MYERLHFISGLPRSGSTLLSALLAQNPKMRAGMSGPVASLVASLLARMSGENEFSIFINEVQRKAILKGVVANYYEADIGKTVFDTNRLWCAKMPLLADLFPAAKVIACVRQTAWIIDSIESLIQRNPFEMSKMFNFDAGGTVYSRSDFLSRGDGTVGYAMNALKEAFYGRHAANLMVLRYETLTSNPAAAMKAVYEFIGEPPFEHDFENVHFDADEFDIRLGTPGLHRVAQRVEAKPRATVLPPDVFNRYAHDNFWENPDLNRMGVRIV